MLKLNFLRQGFRRIYHVAKYSSKKDNILYSKGKTVAIPKISVHEYLWQNLEKWPERIAIESLETGRNYTFAELHKKSLAITKFLSESLKLGKGQTIGIFLRNVPEYPIVVLAAMQAGLKVTTCNPNYTADEIRKQILDSNAEVIFTSTELLPQVQNATSTLNKKILLVEINETGTGFSKGAISFNEIASGPVGKPVDIDLFEDIALLPYSSGTTGLPKGVELTHHNVIANLQQSLSAEFTTHHGRQVDIVPAFLPFFHIYGLIMVLFQNVVCGNKLITMKKFYADNFIKVLKEHRPTHIFGVPLVVTMATNLSYITTADLESIQIFFSGAAPLGAADVDRFRAKTNDKVPLLQGYGMTETSPLTVSQSEVLEKGIKIGGSGFIIPNTEGKIVPLDGSTTTGLGPNETGELLIRGPQVMKGYHNNPQATRDVLQEDGWIRTGDIAHYDEDEHLYITDRLKELIKVKGFQVAPAELEEVLRDHPHVEDAAVIGVPHPINGEAPKAFVVPKSGENVKETHIEEFVASKVAKHKHLVGGVVFVDSIPKNPSGKILRKDLRKMQ